MALQHAAGFVRPGGHLLVVTRSPAEIQVRAEAGGWPPHSDGYWSNPAKGTFQKGISTAEILGLVHQVGLCAVAVQPSFGQGATASHVLLTTLSDAPALTKWAV